MTFNKKEYFRKYYLTHGDKIRKQANDWCVESLSTKLHYTLLFILQPVVNLLLTEYNAHINRATERMRKGI